MFKKLLLFFFCLVACLGTGNAQAASKIQDVVYGVNPNGRLRIVLDTNQATKYKTEMLDNELRVTVYGNLKSSIPRVTTPKKATYVSKVYLERKINATVVHVMMKKPLQKGMFNVFSLKEDKVAKRPTRVVVDVIAAPPQKTFTPKRPSQPSSSPWQPTRPKPSFGNTYSVVGGIRGKRITLDPGHGGTDPGTHGLVTGTYEKDVTLPISKKVKALLEKKGAIVYMTRTTDVDVYGPDATDAEELQARVDVAENSHSDMFISIHINASENTSVGGFSTYYHPKTKYDIQVAQCIQDRLMKTADVDDLGVRYANFYVNKRSTMPGALVECLFLTNKREEKLLISDWFQNKVANAIADGIEDFYNQHQGG
ncbi:N-acetylmuramoyl-L-alanine amidase family protein [Acidaminococcus fermentans]|uniref:N-acetylmuramoyl-L-alanine amidase n=1 Tax=Acidaminococcus fermentans TaxID=905 RepID=A0A1H2ZB95_ACIFE|nr:N-acetylmuramoyl-L-alanine amidase [Acidaminococcus fermentans]MCF0139127.1 N-acetylmuramoyl-L-alanine amidase [Acidaminococcus fermentans]MCI6285489.1 N-acetylmuramoyl-L-alanine amidase [Acidaminococcus fermentans]MDD7195164.1 N-acetylmuramoyl-L-alanine amidase [Acidaminococcus fermentans]MDY2852710.1 N-acetylmuramoyl-L-alanine amidase [Acidaminococcus fermentans]MDY4147904.1 N-acetylmuramoyl-L-alanine amidase [Acidaminococcus fermentans]